ncbi:phage/plasmid primase, P4 family [Sphingomonas citri]
MWSEWDGTRWRPNNSHRAFTYAREIARQHGAPGKANFAAGVERFARADRAHAVNSDLWDSDPMLLGTPGGTVDLRTGDFFDARPADYITKLAGCTPEHGEPTRWLRFLDEALAGDQEAIRFLRLWMGYCLTGDTREHARIFLHGLAGTGKSVFLNTAAAILGDYAVTAAMETFTASKYDRHSTELAMLRGARLVTASETEEGRAWAEARIKQITGGDAITARFMRQDNFTFRPQFKLTIVGNHAPRLSNPDDAMRRRFNILGFNVKPAAPDLQLESNLKAEHGRILAWAIAGCREWQTTGLIRPAAVQDATAEYFAGEDLMGQWLDERCTLRAGAFELPVKLYNDWRKYAEEHGESPGTAIGFGKRMKKRGLGTNSANGIRAHRGVELRHVLGGVGDD